MVITLEDVCPSSVFSVRATIAVNGQRHIVLTCSVERVMAIAAFRFRNEVAYDVIDLRS